MGPRRNNEKGHQCGGEQNQSAGSEDADRALQIVDRAPACRPDHNGDLHRRDEQTPCAFRFVGNGAGEPCRPSDGHGAERHSPQRNEREIHRQRAIERRETSAKDGHREGHGRERRPKTAFEHEAGEQGAEEDSTPNPRSTLEIIAIPAPVVNSRNGRK